MSIRNLLYGSIFLAAITISGCSTTRPILNSETKSPSPKISITPLPTELEARNHYYNGVWAMLSGNSTSEAVTQHFDSAQIKGFDNTLLWLKMAELNLDSS